ncbi:hypothetical protein ACFHW1_15620 [Micromonospora sp. LOL_014]|uniref:hypothetical protein n=1 Tax=Micromonospora sp. LOL_014 TaxID=3345415 RepID=UPI003A835B4D
MVSTRRTLAGTTVAGTMVDNELWTPWRCERTWPSSDPVDVSGVISFGDSPAAELTQIDPEDGEITVVAVDVWVDEQYQPRRVKLVMGTKNDITMNYRLRQGGHRRGPAGRRDGGLRRDDAGPARPRRRARRLTSDARRNSDGDGPTGSRSVRRRFG